jgi:hypothetical protein
MTDTNKVQLQVIQPFSDEKHGGVLLPAIFGTLGFGILLYGIFMGSTGLYGDTSEITFADGAYEFWRELVRILVFSLLLLAAIRVNCWRMRRPLGKLFLAALRCLAIVVLIDSVRVVEMEHLFQSHSLSFARLQLSCFSQAQFENQFYFQLDVLLVSFFCG